MTNHTGKSLPNHGPIGPIPAAHGFTAHRSEHYVTVYDAAGRLYRHIPLVSPLYCSAIENPAGKPAFDHAAAYTRITGMTPPPDRAKSLIRTVK